MHEGSKTAGLLSWWQLGGQVQLDNLAQLWTQAGLDEQLLPEPPSQVTALRRAIIQKYPKMEINSIPKTQGFAVSELVFKDVVGDVKPDPELRVFFKAWLEEDVLRISHQYEDEAPALRRDLWQRMQLAQTVLEAKDLSFWLVSQAEKVGAVSLRPAGGVYFIPETHVATWQRLARCIETASTSTIHEIPALRTEKAVASILSALRSEIEGEVEKLEEYLQNGDPGIRALTNRSDQTKAMLAKVAQYERLLGNNLAALADSVEAVHDKVQQAMLAAED